MPPFSQRDDGPNRFDEPERPCSLQESIHGREDTGGCERQNEPRAALLKRIENQHCSYREKSEKGQCIHEVSLLRS